MKIYFPDIPRQDEKSPTQATVPLRLLIPVFGIVDQARQLKRKGPQGRFLFENLFAGENFKGDASVKEVPLTHRATHRWPSALSTSPKWLRWGYRLGQP